MTHQPLHTDDPATLDCVGLLCPVPIYLAAQKIETMPAGALLRILAQARPYWHWLAGFLLMIGIVSVLDSYATFLGKRIIDEGILANDRVALFRILARYAMLILVQSVAVFSFIWLAGLLSERIQYDLRRKMFAHLQDLSLSYYDRTPVGWIMSRVTSDAERVSELVTWGLLDTLSRTEPFSYWLKYSLRAIVYAWGAVEALRYHRLLARRVGAGHPCVVDAVLLRADLLAD